MLAATLFSAAQATWAAVTVSLTAPTNGSVVVAPVSLSANASANGGYTVSKVEFFQGSTLIGTAATAPYSISWDAQPGTYALTARATAIKKGSPDQTATSSTANITVNAPPVISLTTPVDGAVFGAPANVTVSATASDSDGTIASVNFYWWDRSGTLVFVWTVASPPYTVTWSGVPAGAHFFWADATDNHGTSTVSTQASVTVTALPTVTLTSPAPNATFTAPANIALQAQAADADGTISRVEFYHGSTLIATVTSAPYTFSWTGVPQGAYSLTAKAIDNVGATATSTPVNITVNSGVAQVYFIHADHLNTPRLVADATGTTVWRWDQQEPFGVNVPDENPSGLGAFEFPLRFPGQYADKETNLAYNYSRNYDPNLGRYTESDPIGLLAGLNTYAYVRSRPTYKRDPFGLLDDFPGSEALPLFPTESFALSDPNASFGDIATNSIRNEVSAAVTNAGNQAKCFLKCVGKDLAGTIVVMGLVSAAAAADLIPLGAVIVGVYVYQRYGGYYTVIKYTYTLNKCINDCMRCP